MSKLDLRVHDFEQTPPPPGGLLPRDEYECAITRAEFSRPVLHPPRLVVTFEILAVDRTPSGLPDYTKPFDKIKHRHKGLRGRTLTLQFGILSENAETAYLASAQLCELLRAIGIEYVEDAEEFVGRTVTVHTDRSVDPWDPSRWVMRALAFKPCDLDRMEAPTDD